MEVARENKARNQIELFVPGRLCLFGEHSDWAGFYRITNKEIEPGRAIVTGIEQGIHAFAQKAQAFEVFCTLPGMEQHLHCQMELQELREIAAEGGFFSYVAGVASYFKEHYKVQGIQIQIDKMTLPMKRGLSSSAAICVLVARAFNRLYDLHMNTLGEMQAAYRGEQRTPSKCGRLDQACAFGVRPVEMRFDGNDISVGHLRIKGDFYWVFADLNASKDTVKILADLNQCYPVAETEVEQKVWEALGKDNKTIVKQAVTYFQEGDAKKLGELMYQAQDVFDKKVAPASPEELRSPVLHSILKDSTVMRLVYGGKGVGSQGDGTVQFLAKDEVCQNKLVEYLKQEKQMEAYAFTIRQQRSVRKAIIPVAGFGTRMYPETRGVKKEFLPVMDYDGLVKPAILVLLEEMDRAGIEKICLVIGKEDRRNYQEFFEQELSEEYLAKLPEKMRQYEKTILRIGKKLRYVIQEERKGFGHAVYQCRNFTNREPVLLLLGDMLYKSYEERSCVEQLLDAYEDTEKLTVGITETEPEVVSRYGILTGVWLEEQKTMLEVAKMVEKPTKERAEKELRTKMADGREAYLTVLGNYVLTPAVFECLEKNILEQKMTKGEIQLTDALDEVREQYGMRGCHINGRVYDLGNPASYRETVAEYGK